MRAIFGEDFLEVESKSAWTKVHEFEIRIRAQDEGIQDKVSIVIRFKLFNYPKVIPTFILHSEIGLSSIAVNQLVKILIEI